MDNSTFDSTFKVGDVIVRDATIPLVVRITNMKIGRSSFTCDKLDANGKVTSYSEGREKSRMGEWKLKEAAKPERQPLGTVARTDNEFDEWFQKGDTISRQWETVVIDNICPGSSTFNSISNDRGFTNWHKSASGFWKLVAHSDQATYGVGDYVSRPSWQRSDDCRPVKVSAIGNTLLLGVRDGETEEKSWYKTKGGETFVRYDKPVGPLQAFKFVDKEGKTRKGAYQWPLPTDGKPVVVECDLTRIVPGNHVCPNMDGDGVMAATTIAAAESGGHMLRDSIGLWLEYMPEDVLGQGSGKIRLRRVTVTGVFDPYVQQNRSDSRFQRLLQNHKS